MSLSQELKKACSRPKMKHQTTTELTELRKGLIWQMKFCLQQWLKVFGNIVGNCDTVSNEIVSNERQSFYLENVIKLHIRHIFLWQRYCE